MSFKDFTANILSTRDFEETRLKGIIISDLQEYLKEINTGIGIEKGFSLIMMENGQEIFNTLEGIGGYSGIMIRSPYYVGLAAFNEEPETEFYGAYYMQSLVKKLYDMNLGSCWINVRGIPHDVKNKLLQNNVGRVNYLLAFGIPDEKAVKQKAPHMTVANTPSSYKQDPYGTKVNEAVHTDKARHSLGEIAYLHEWGRQATIEELETRGLTDIFFYVRNAPSYKNLQPYRLIVKDGETELTVIHPENEGSYTDAGIMMYILQGLAKDLGIPGKWEFINDGSGNKEYKVVAKIEL